MYCYVKGLSKFIDGFIDNSSIKNDKYQWLPSDIKITNSKVKFESYINNLSQSNLNNLKLYKTIEKILHLFIPHFEDIIGSSLKGNAQVIVKVAKYKLTKENPEYSASNWHLEGMPYENIIASGIYYFHTHGIQNDRLEFRRALAKPTSYEQYDNVGVVRDYGIYDEDELNEYLGEVETIKNRCLVFPNFLQHRVTRFELKPNKDHGSRGILVFFLINPKIKIISTKDIPEQQTLMTSDEALNHMKALMTERKYYFDKVNEEIFEREFSLCEH
jgi:hypothetical protein